MVAIRLVQTVAATPLVQTVAIILQVQTVTTQALTIMIAPATTTTMEVSRQNLFDLLSRALLPQQADVLVHASAVWRRLVPGLVRQCELQHLARCNRGYGGAAPNT